MTPVDHYTYFSILDYLPLSDTERKIFALVLTFADRKNSKRTGKGLTMLNAAIGRAINRSEHTVKKSIATLRQKGMIYTDKAQSQHRIIWPGNPESYLTTLDGQVEKILLDHFRILLDQYSGPPLDHSGRSTKGKEGNKKKKTDSPFPFSVSETPPDFEPTPEPVPPPVPDKPALESLKAQADPAMVKRVFESLGFAEGLAL